MCVYIDIQSYTKTIRPKRKDRPEGGGREGEKAANNPPLVSLLVVLYSLGDPRELITISMPLSQKDETLSLTLVIFN